MPGWPSYNNFCQCHHHHHRWVWFYECQCGRHTIMQVLPWAIVSILIHHQVSSLSLLSSLSASSSIKIVFKIITTSRKKQTQNLISAISQSAHKVPPSPSQLHSCPPLACSYPLPPEPPLWLELKPWELALDQG